MMKINSKDILATKHDEDCILSKSIEFRDLMDLEKGEVVRFQPCTSERGDIMAEINLQPIADDTLIDPHILCRLLRAYSRRFTKMKCSSKLGIARVKWNSRRIYIYKQGKFNIRFAANKEDAIKTIHSMIRIVLGSILCERCGEPAIKCSLGLCGNCLSHGLKSISLDKTTHQLSMRGFKSLYEAVDISKDILMNTSEIQSALKSSQLPIFKNRIREGIEFFLNASLRANEVDKASANIGYISLGFLIQDFHKKSIELIKTSQKSINGYMDIKSINKMNDLILSIFGNLLELFRDNNSFKLEVIHQMDNEIIELIEDIDSRSDDTSQEIIRKSYLCHSPAWSNILEMYSS